MMYIEVNNTKIKVTNIDKSFSEANKFRLSKKDSKTYRNYWSSVFIELLKHKIKTAGNMNVRFELFKPLWKEFEQIPLNQDDVLGADFLLFGKGENEKSEIINWFEEYFEISINDFIK